MNASEPRWWCVLAGGGTAGHVLPAIAIGQALSSRRHQKASLQFVGSQRGIEKTLVPNAGFPLVLLPGRGIQRRATLENLSALAGVLRGIGEMVIKFGTKRPAIVVSVGGYASVPCVFAAVLWRVPLVVAESNAKAGVANRIGAKFAKVSAVAFPDTGLPRAVLTGNPVRAEIAALFDHPVYVQQRAAARGRLGVSGDQMLVVVFGGSLGARSLNNAAIGLAELLADRGDLVLYLVTGEREGERVEAELAQWKLRHPHPGLDWRVVRYEYEMPAVLAAGDLAVSRAGATSVADACAIGLPSVFVPLPNSAEDHQRLNAEAVVRVGGGELLADHQCTPDRLAEVVVGLLADRPRLAQMANAARSLARPQAAADIAELVERYARRSDPSLTLLHAV